MENFTKPKWKNYDFTMFWPRITTSRCIAVNWFLRVYWLLPLSTDDSFAEHRRFFCRAPTILLPSTDDSFAEHRRLFCRAPTTLLPSTINTWTIQFTSFPKGVIFYFTRLFLFINPKSVIRKKLIIFYWTIWVEGSAYTPLAQNKRVHPYCILWTKQQMVS